MKGFYTSTITFILTDILIICIVIVAVCMCFYKHMPEPPLNQRLDALIKSHFSTKIENSTIDSTCIMEWLFTMLMGRMLMMSLHSKTKPGYFEKLLSFSNIKVFKNITNSYEFLKLTLIAIKGFVIAVMCGIFCYFTSNLHTESTINAFRSSIITLGKIIAVLIIVVYGSKRIKCQHYWVILLISNTISIDKKGCVFAGTLDFLNNWDGCAARYDTLSNYFSQEVENMIDSRELHDKIFIKPTEPSQVNQIIPYIHPCFTNYLLVHCAIEDTEQDENGINKAMIWNIFYLDKKPDIWVFLLECIFIVTVFLIFRWIDNTLIGVYNEEVESKQWIKGVLMIVTVLLRNILCEMCSNGLNHFLIHNTNIRLKKQIRDTQSYMEWLITDYYISHKQPMYFPSFLMLLSSDKPNIYSYLKTLLTNQ